MGHGRRWNLLQVESRRQRMQPRRKIELGPLLRSFPLGKGQIRTGQERASKSWKFRKCTHCHRLVHLSLNTGMNIPYSSSLCNGSCTAMNGHRHHRFSSHPESWPHRASHDENRGPAHPSHRGSSPLQPLMEPSRIQDPKEQLFKRLEVNYEVVLSAVFGGCEV